MIPNAAWRPDTVITDVDGNERYVLLDQENKMRSYQAVFGDLEGRRLVCVKRHLTRAFWRDGFYFCTYRPNYPNQRPLKDRDLDNKKIYPFSYLQLEPMKGRFYYKYFDDDQQLGPTRLFAENPWLGFMMVCCSPLLRCSRFSTRFKKSSRQTHIHVDQWRNIVSVKAGSDLLAALCLAYVFDRCQAQPMVTVIGRDEDDEYEDSDESLESISSRDDDDDVSKGFYNNDDDDDDTKQKNKANFEIDGNPDATYKDHPNGDANGHPRQRGAWDDNDNDDDDDGDEYAIHNNNYRNNGHYDENASTKAPSVFSSASTLAAPPKVDEAPPTSSTTTPTDDFFAASSSASQHQPRDPDGHTSIASARSRGPSSVAAPLQEDEEQQPDFFTADAKSIASAGRQSVASRHAQMSVASARSRQSVASRQQSVASRQPSVASHDDDDPYGNQLKPNEIV
jgi:hypothetical protein